MSPLEELFFYLVALGHSLSYFAEVLFTNIGKGYEDGLKPSLMEGSYAICIALNLLNLPDRFNKGNTLKQLRENSHNALVERNNEILSSSCEYAAKHLNVDVEVLRHGDAIAVSSPEKILFIGSIKDFIKAMDIHDIKYFSGKDPNLNKVIYALHIVDIWIPADSLSTFRTCICKNCCKLS